MFSGIKYIHTVVWQTSPITSSMLYPSNTNSSFPPPAFPGNHCTTLGFYAFDHPQFNSVYSLRHVWLLATPWTAACQASLSITNSRSMLKLTSIKSVMPSNHLILCRALLLQPSIVPSIRIFSNKSVLHIRWPKYWSFSFSTSHSNEYSGLISFKNDWFDLLAVKGTLKSLLQHHSSKASILRCSALTQYSGRW